MLGAVIYVKDLDRMRAFYQGVCGLSVLQSTGDFIVLEGSGSTLTLVTMPAQIADSFEITNPPERREDTPIKLIFAVDSIEHGRSAALDLGGAIGPIDNEWEFRGRTVCDGMDPEGNVIQLSSPA
jgi:catechol 2,3-dioxygenase-like lactoylglutathione lyase family enzyme